MLEERLRSLDASEVAVHLPGVAGADEVHAACERTGARVVALHEGARVVVTADGVGVDGMVRCLKDEVDVIAPDASHVFVLRVLGDVPLAPTMDAYLDVEMIPGRDEWV